MFSPKLVWSGLQLSGDAATETQNIRILHDIETTDIFDVKWRAPTAGTRHWKRGKRETDALWAQFSNAKE